MGVLIFRLQQQSLDALLVEAQADADDDSRAMNEIVRRFDLKAKRIAGALTTDRDLREDLASAARLAVVRAVRRHSGQAGFPVFASRYMEGAARRELGRWIRPGAIMHTASTVSIDVGVGLDRLMDTEPVLATEDLVQVTPWGCGEVADALAKMSPRQRGLLVRRYIDDQPLGSIAGGESTSVSAVSHRLATCHRALAGLLAA